jgi:dehydrogenase/reductase SDR family protein 12
MTDVYARNHSKIFFATMHPGWSDTPAVQTSMPQFREKLLNSLRTPEQGADTLVWMCCYEGLESFENGSFFQDRKPVSKHLPLSWTTSTPTQEADFVKKIDDLYERFKN